MSSTLRIMNRFTLRFGSAELERLYRESEDRKSLRIMRIGMLASITLYAVACLFVVLFAPAAVRGTYSVAYIWASAAVVAVLGVAVYLLTMTAPFLRRPQAALAALCAVIPVLVAAGLRFLPPEMVSNRGFMFVVLHIFTVYSLLRMRLLPAIAAGFAGVLGYVAVMGLARVIEPLPLMRHSFWLVTCNLWGVLICYHVESALRREFASTLEVQQERERAEGLLLNILPAAIAQRLKASTRRIAEHAEPVTVLFADIVGFTPLSATKQPGELVDLLDRVFTRFDDLAAQHGLEKIKTIGDAYMAVAGLPHPQPDHALRAARMALAIVDCVAQAARDTGEPLQVRVGLHSGPVVAGVIGRSKFSYDLWGDTVNTASRMESSGLPGAVHCTSATASSLGGEFSVQSRGLTEVKGKGTMETFLLASAAGPA